MHLKQSPYPAPSPDSLRRARRFWYAWLALGLSVVALGCPRGIGLPITALVWISLSREIFLWFRRQARPAAGDEVSLFLLSCFLGLFASLFLEAILGLIRDSTPALAAATDAWWHWLGTHFGW
jgi:hypothetical protein